MTGEVDSRTWTKLVAMTRTPTRAERHNILVAGPALMKSGSSGLVVRGLQTGGAQLGWYSALVTGNDGRTPPAPYAGSRPSAASRVTGAVDQRTPWTGCAP